MGLEVTVTGQAELRRVAGQIRAAGDKGLGREMGEALRRAARPVQASIRTEYAGLPRRGGYAAAFSRSLRFRTSLRARRRDAAFRLTTYADGTKDKRDIRRLEAGELRHPVYGRSRRIRRGRRAGTARLNPWAVTRVKGGYHERGTDGAADEAEREMVTVLDGFAARLTS